MAFNIENKVALVTGANRGIGKAIVDSFIAHGAKKVYLAVRRPESTKALEEQYGNKVVTLIFDSANPESIKAAAKSAQDVDIVVNNAGVLEPADPLSPDAERNLAKEMDVNVYGLIRVAQAFTPILETKAQSAFVQLNSVASIKNFTQFSTYSASKAASYSLTQGLREQLAPKGIQVLSVHPGPILTDMTKQLGLDSGDPAESVSEGIVNALTNGAFLLFPDTMARDFQGAYQSYADAFINTEIAE